ncbi:MAG: bifunctional hydroxymethylpyrimidine kinase/phosphomethylpyrimidine kinase [Luteolibacter sp.]|jgi:hydroxymethylpyrimidine/phosphomethylpyrimidine kinase
MINPPPVALSIAGSDCCAGAGAQADLKTFQHFEVHGLTAITSVVSETPEVVEAVHPVPIDIIESQIRLLLKSYPVAAIKTGMLHSVEVIECVVRCLEPYPEIALVVDPVMVASSGSPLIEQDAVEAYREQLFARATLITPNLDEAETLLRAPIDSYEAMEQAALQLSLETGAAVLLKGGHLHERIGNPENDDDCIDLLTEGQTLVTLRHPRIPDADTHGSGCSLAAAITACLAKGLSGQEAVTRATDYIHESLRNRYQFNHPQAIQALNQGTLPGN